MLERFAHVVARRRFIVIGLWVVLTIFGGFAAAKVSKRWYQSFSIPGKSGYETSQRTLKDFGVGAFCGFGRMPPSDMPRVLREHKQALSLLGV